MKEMCRGQKGSVEGKEKVGEADTISLESVRFAEQKKMLEEQAEAAVEETSGNQIGASGVNEMDEVSEAQRDKKKNEEAPRNMMRGTKRRELRGMKN